MGSVTWLFHWTVQKVLELRFAWRRDWDFLFYQRWNNVKSRFQLYNWAHHPFTPNKIQQLEHGRQDDQSVYKHSRGLISHDQHHVHFYQFGAVLFTDRTGERLLLQAELLQNRLGLWDVSVPDRLSVEVDPFPMWACVS